MTRLYHVRGTGAAPDDPVDAETLRAWAAEGRLLPETLLAEVGTDRLVRARSLEALIESWPPSDVPRCRHCGRLTLPGQGFCAHCGASQNSAAVWPPASGVEAPVAGKAKPSADSGAVIAGMLSCWALLYGVPWCLMLVGRLFAWYPGVAVWLCGVAAVLSLYALIRRSAPPFARGLLLGLPIALVVTAILGALAALIFWDILKTCLREGLLTPLISWDSQ